jgi:hypothetical protein
MRNKTMVLTVVIVILAFIGLGGRVLRYYIRENMESSFNTKLEASKVIEHGWIPSDLPDDASNIYVTYDLDGNLSNGYFTSNDSDKFAKDKEVLDTSVLKEMVTHESKKFKDKIRVEIIAQPHEYTILNGDGCIYAIKDSKIYFWMKLSPKKCNFLRV